MNSTDINDVRTHKDFTNITFSKYQKVKVKQELLQSMKNGKIEYACNWTAELICAGHYIDIWEVIILYISRYIHIGNPKLPIYISKRSKAFKEILENGYLDNEIAMRNNKKIRQLFTEIICILTFSKTKHMFERIKVDKNDFDISNLTDKLRAPNIHFIDNIFRNGDSNELFIAMNEFSYNLSKNIKNTIIACYWVEWIFEFEIRCKKKKQKCLIERREWIPVQDKFQMDIVWLIWEIILFYAKENHNTITQKIIDSLLELFTLRYSSATKRKRRYIIYFAISLLTDIYDLTTHITTRQKEIERIIDNIEIIYKNVKKNEIAPNTNYLFHNIKEKSNLDKTIAKLNMMNNIPI